MTSYLSNLFRLFAFNHKFSVDSSKQQLFLKKSLVPLLQTFEQENDNSLDEDDLRKMRSYGVAIPSMLGEAFCELRGRKMTERERYAITYLGSLTGLFDDLFDRRDLSDDYIRQMLEAPENYTPANTNEKLMQALYQKVFEYTGKEIAIKTAALKVYEAQVRSRRQKNGHLSADELKQITFDKGGVTMQIYRLAFEGEPDAVEQELLYRMGAIGQLENDIFDVYKDFQDKIVTLVTLSNDMRKLNDFYNDLIRNVLSLIDKTAYADKNKHYFRLFASLVMSRGLVALKPLIKLQTLTQNIFTLNRYSRTQLICNMETRGNVFRLLHYAAKCAKK
ncbi:MAG: hypothetical protein PHH37_11115 [Paludibacter sp.]|nr:hypothetical protein [Paludibacter sp.]